MAVVSRPVALDVAKTTLITGLTFSDTNETEFSHTLGVVPDMVIPMTTNAAGSGYTVAATAVATSSKYYLKASNASATASVLLVFLKK